MLCDSMTLLDKQVTRLSGTARAFKSAFGRIFGGVVLAAGADKPPKDWLPGIVPPAGIGPSPTGLGLGFITYRLVPFLITAAIFLVLILALIFTIVGGIMWITSSGDKEATLKAKNTVTYALVGLALGLGSFVILNIIGQFFGVNLTK